MSEITLRSPRATLAALRMARRCMEGQADDEAATHLLLLLVLLKVASDAHADRRAPGQRGVGGTEIHAPSVRGRWRSFRPRISNASAARRWTGWPRACAMR
jgi:hypothetical protein